MKYLYWPKIVKIYRKSKGRIIDSLNINFRRLKGFMISSKSSLSRPYSFGTGILFAKRFNISRKKFVKSFLCSFLSILISN